MAIVTISTGAFYKYNYKEIFEIVSQTNCRDIELCLNNTFVDVSFAEIIKEIEKRNLTVHSIHTPFEFLWKPNEDERFWIDRSTELAKELGAKIITTHITFKDGDSLEEQHKRNLIELRDNDITVCTENMPAVWANSDMDSFLCHPSKLLEFLNEFGISVTFDTTHWASTGKPLLYGYEMFKKHIKNIHISDYSDGIEHKTLGTGNLPIAEFVQTLNKDGYTNPLTIELDLEDKRRNPIETKTQAIDALNTSLQEVYKIHNRKLLRGINFENT
ncbi:MAG: sugar phosphate isomerase/epimerase [Clostridiales bacterium]|jgi:sugar phosphate isomerase/epimerase|nr:sugar phosphate isomerase/epimerase [Clostridiales bacterium]